MGVADLPPSTHAHHEVPLTTTGPVTEGVRAAPIPDTGATVVDRAVPITAPVATPVPVEATREVTSVKEEPTIIKAAPTGGPRDVGPHTLNTGIKPAGSTVPSM